MEKDSPNELSPKNNFLASEIKGKTATPPPLQNKKKKFLKWGLILSFLLLSGVVLAFYFHIIEIPFAVKNKKGKAQEQPKEISVGPMIKLNPLIINLNEKEGRHFLKVTIVLELGHAKWVKEVQDMTAQLTNMIIIHLSDKKLADIHKPEAKEILKKELLEKMAKILGGSMVKEIYWEEFLYQ